MPNIPIKIKEEFFLEPKYENLLQETLQKAGDAQRSIYIKKYFTDFQEINQENYIFFLKYSHFLYYSQNYAEAG